jgi:hypothetical protein
LFPTFHSIKSNINIPHFLTPSYHLPFLTHNLTTVDFSVLSPTLSPQNLTLFPFFMSHYCWNTSHTDSSSTLTFSMFFPRLRKPFSTCTRKMVVSGIQHKHKHYLLATAFCNSVFIPNSTLYQKKIAPLTTLSLYFLSLLMLYCIHLCLCLCLPYWVKAASYSDSYPNNQMGPTKY